MGPGNMESFLLLGFLMKCHMSPAILQTIWRRQSMIILTISGRDFALQYIFFYIASEFKVYISDFFKNFDDLVFALS